MSSNKSEDCRTDLNKSVLASILTQVGIGNTISPEMKGLTRKLREIQDTDKTRVYAIGVSGTKEGDRMRFRVSRSSGALHFEPADEKTGARCRLAAKEQNTAMAA